MTMKATRHWFPAALLIFTVPWASGAQATSGAAPVAGLAPWQRPTQAPRITAEPPLDRQRALHGVLAPIPASLGFLDSQGGWYNPFTHPGMTAPYDLRGWHDAPPSPAGRQ